MEVKLVWSTPDAEKLILYMGRVSNPANQNSDSTKLIDYMLKQHHWSPFEMANMCIEIKTSRAISAQILRHRSFSFQEFSQRYAKVQSTEKYPARRQDTKNRQNSIDDMSLADRSWFEDVQEEIEFVATDYYEQALSRGIAKEQARFLLPMASSTTMYMNGSLRSWIHYINLRTDPSTQLEHREIAEEIKNIFCQEYPIVAKALGWVDEEV